MGNSQSTQKVNFEDVQYAIKHKDTHILINTLGENDQTCLISGSVLASQEELFINKCLQNGTKSINIIIYGMNSNDEKITTKCGQLNSLGFYNVYLYAGGLFEWLLLQDIYGSQEFPTTKKELDLLKFKPNKIFNIPLIEY
jgi:hypothetical protein